MNLKGVVRVLVFAVFLSSIVAQQASTSPLFSEITPLIDYSNEYNASLSHEVLLSAPTAPKTFLFWVFEGNPSVLNQSEQDLLLPLTLGQYSTGSQSPQYGDSDSSYRTRLRAASPNAFIGLYVSSVTSNNPSNPALYPVTSPSDPFCGGDSGAFNADLYNYSFRPDSHSFHRAVDPAYFNSAWGENASSFQPWSLSNQTQAWWNSGGCVDSENRPTNCGPGLYAWWPFEFFNRRGWILPNTQINCRPTIAVGNPAVRTFVGSTLVRFLAAFPNATSITFDNVQFYQNTLYSSHPGQGVPGSPYASPSAWPDTDMVGYLTAVRQTLNQSGKKLLINSGFRPDLFAGKVDAIYFELSEDPTRQSTPATISAKLQGYRQFISNSTAVTTGFTGTNSRPFGLDRDDMNFFFAVALLVYEPNKFAFSPRLFTPNNFGYNGNPSSPTYNALRFFPDFYLPTVAGNSLGLYQQPSSVPYFYYRKYQNMAVVLNANDHDIILNDSQLASFGLMGYGLPHRFTPKQGIIAISNCSSVAATLAPGFAPACGNYSTAQRPEPALLPGDANCNHIIGGLDVNADREAFYLAATNATAYAAQYGYCGNMSGALNFDSVSGVTLNDYWMWFRQAYMMGDVNCDGPTNLSDYPVLDLAYDGNATLYGVTYPHCDRLHLADLTRDGQVNDQDRCALQDLLSLELSPFCPGAKGDVNFDGRVNNFDIDFFIGTLLAPNPGALDPRAVVGADMNCNGRVENFDIDLFVIRVVQGAVVYRNQRRAIFPSNCCDNPSPNCHI